MVGDDERISATSALQFKATGSLELYVDTIVSQFDQRYNYFQGNQWYAGAGALGPSPTDSVTVDANGVETAWRGTNVFAWTQSNRFAFRSEEHTSELQSLMRISYAVFCLKKTTKQHSQR